MGAMHAAPRRGAALSCLLVLLSHCCAQPGVVSPDGATGSLWLPLSRDEAALDPRWRYSHGMAAGPRRHSIVVSHGYNLRDPDGNSVPDWRDDTWMLSPTGSGRASSAVGWRQLAGQGARPPSRYGGTLLRLGELLVLFGGDDGGLDVPSGTRKGYVWGSYRNDVWVLPAAAAEAQGPHPDPRQAEGWVLAGTVDGAAQPDGLSLHACLTVPDPLLDPDAAPADLSLAPEVGLCFGGLTAPLDGAGRRGTRDPDVGTAALSDTGDVWLLRVVALTEEGGAASGYEARWSPLDAGGMEDGSLEVVTPPPRHGAGVALTSRVVLLGTAPRQPVIEHSVIVFGGGGLACEVSSLLARGYRLNVDVAVAGGSNSNGVAPCQYGDLWRLVWTLGEVPRWQRLVPTDGDEEYEEGSGGEGLLPGEEVLGPTVTAARAAGRRFLAASAARQLNGAAPAVPAFAPRPRSMLGLAATGNGAVLFGGAACLPACDCLDDTWYLLAAPVWGEPSTAANSAHSVDALAAGYRWVRAGTALPGIADVAPLGAKNRGLGSIELLTPWLGVADAAVEGVDASSVGRVVAAGAFALPATDAATGALPAAATPPPRYRHGLVSDTRPALAATAALAAALGSDEDQAGGGVWRWAPPLLPVVLFGGETYTPSSRYFGDTWLLLTDAARVTSAARALPCLTVSHAPLQHAAVAAGLCSPASTGSSSSGDRGGLSLSVRVAGAFNTAAAHLGVSPLALKLLALAAVLSGLANRASRSTDGSARSSSERLGGGSPSRAARACAALAGRLRRGRRRAGEAGQDSDAEASGLLSRRPRLEDLEPAMVVVVDGGAAATTSAVGARPLRHRG